MMAPGDHYTAKFDAIVPATRPMRLGDVTHHGLCVFRTGFGFFRKGDRGYIDYDWSLGEYNVYEEMHPDRLLLCVTPAGLQGRNLREHAQKERVRLEGRAQILRNADADDTWAQDILAKCYPSN